MVNKDQELNHTNLQEGCKIAGIDGNIVCCIDAAECLNRTYGRKILGLRESERSTFLVWL